MADETRLRGALLAMVVAATVVAIVGAMGIAFAAEQLRAIGIRYMIAVLFVTAWSLVFVAMTLLRLRATPVVASAGLVAWIAYRFCVAVFAGRWPLVVDLLGEVVLVAGFCGYMATGSLPNAYYRRRLPAS